MDQDGALVEKYMEQVTHIMDQMNITGRAYYNGII